MTKSGIALCCILLAAVACSDKSTDGNGPIDYVTWETTWGGPGYDEANCALAVDGGVIVAGRTPGPCGADAACAVKFDGETGSPVWETVLGSPYPEQIRDIAATPDGGAVMVGYVWGAFDALDSYFIKINSGGGVVWKGRYSGVHGRSEAFCIAVASDGTVFVAGMSRSTPTIPVVPDVEYIIKVNPENGEVIREAEVGSISGTVWVEDIRDMIAVTVPEPGLVLVGRRGRGPVILKMNEELDSVLWENTPEVEGAMLYGVTATHDGSGYVAAGATDSHSKMCLIGFDLEGNTIWSNVFAYSDSGRSDARGVAALPDGYLVAGYTCERFPEDEGDAYIVKTDLQGRVMYDTTYGWLNSPEGASDVDVAPQGGGYVAARTFGKGSSENRSGDFYVIRTDPKGLQ